ncbi:MAG: histidinol dehydrogenase [Myxococcota bacterium]|nr:histidinol dehydrogenase [Myxococcota bacterium]
MTTPLPILDLAAESGRSEFEARLARLRGTTSLVGDTATVVAEIIEDVRVRGDAALVDWMRKFADRGFEASQIRVAEGDFEAADASVDPALRKALEASIANVRTYQEHILPAAVAPVTIQGAELGLRYSPVESAGLAVPGGAAVLFSSVIMLAVPAMVAGVDPKKIRIVHPPPTRVEGQPDPPRDISPVVLATCRMLGIDTVYRIGGAQAVAALAYGTETVEPVDLIAGPGNVYVQLGKQMLAGVVGTDGGFYGPSEIVTVADESADPACVASDLIAQAEHDPGKCFLVSWSADVVRAIVDDVARQLRERGRSAIIERALENDSAALVVADEDEAVAVADRLSAEHVNLAVADPERLLARLRNGGEFFLGDQSAVASGDYYAGPSHCLPTGTTARFASGVSAHTFLKRSGTVYYRAGRPATVSSVIARRAGADGRDAHAESARARGRAAKRGKSK